MKYSEKHCKLNEFKDELFRYKVGWNSKSVKSLRIFYAIVPLKIIKDWSK